MKIIFLFLFLSCQFLSNGQINPVYQESIENYYARQKADKKFKLIKAEIKEQRNSYKYVLDSLTLLTVERLLRRAHSGAKNTKISDAEKQAYKEVTIYTLDTYFAELEKYNKKDATKVILTTGNILYTVEEELKKTNLYENFIAIFDMQNKLLFRFIVED